MAMAPGAATRQVKAASASLSGPASLVAGERDRHSGRADPALSDAPGAQEASLLQGGWATVQPDPAAQVIALPTGTLPESGDRSERAFAASQQAFQTSPSGRIDQPAGMNDGAVVAARTAETPGPVRDGTPIRQIRDPAMEAGPGAFARTPGRDPLAGPGTHVPGRPAGQARTAGVSEGQAPGLQFQAAATGAQAEPAIQMDALTPDRRATAPPASPVLADRAPDPAFAMGQAAGSQSESPPASGGPGQGRPPAASLAPVALSDLVLTDSRSAAASGGVSDPAPPPRPGFAVSMGVESAAPTLTGPAATTEAPIPAPVSAAARVLAESPALATGQDPAAATQQAPVLSWSAGPPRVPSAGSDQTAVRTGQASPRRGGLASPQGGGVQSAFEGVQTTGAQARAPAFAPQGSLIDPSLASDLLPVGPVEAGLSGDGASSEADMILLPQAAVPGRPADSLLPGAVLAPPVRGAPETVARLAAGMIEKLEARSGRFDLQLDPNGMGSVDVRVQIGADGQLTASLGFESARAAAELRGRSDELRQSLEQAGFTVPEGGLSFDFTGQGQGQQGRPGPDLADSRRGGAAFARALVAQDAPPAVSTRFRTVRGLDVLI